MNIQIISDGQLYEMCRNFGVQALEARRKFIGLLPEVNRRRLYEKKRFSSIFHFAAVLAGVSKEQVRLAINLDSRFEKMPQLRKLLVEGLSSVNKLSRVVSIATVENQAKLAEKVLILSKATLEVFVRDCLLEKNRVAQSVDMNIEIKDGLFRTQSTNSSSSQNQDGFAEPQTEAKGLPGQTEDDAIVHDFKVSPSDRSDVVEQNPINSAEPKKLITYVKTPILSDEVKRKLNELQLKEIDINQIILEALKRRDQEIAQEKEVQAEKAEQKMIEQCVEGKTISRHVPAETKRLMKIEFGEKCAISTCNNKAVVIHHTNRFSISRDHNPYYLAQLCDPHHKIAAAPAARRF